MTRTSDHTNMDTVKGESWMGPETVTWDGSGLKVGGTSIDSIQNCFRYFPDYPSHYWTYSEPRANKTEQAFKIVGKLMEMKLVEDMTVKRFIELVNEIAKIV